MEAQLIKILLYFDVFSYPLTREEIMLYAGFHDPARLMSRSKKWSEKAG
jgi:hypothetical protein